jgi:hypothetical protein
MGRIWRVAVIFLVAISLAGCGGAKATPTKPVAKKPVKTKKTKTGEKKPSGKTKIGGVFGGLFLDEYRTALTSDDPNERIRGCQGLGNLGERAVDALDELRDVAARDSSKRVRVEAKKAIKEIED